MRKRFVRRGAAAALVLGAMPMSAAPGDGSAYVAKMGLRRTARPP